MEEEYILKLKEHDEAEIIPKDKWDGTKDKHTFRFVPLGEGKYTDIFEENGKIKDVRIYTVTFGLIFDINNEKDPGYLFYIGQYKEGKHTWDWVRMVRGALMYEAKKYLKEKHTWEAITTAVNTIIDPEALTEFKKIIESIALGYAFYEYLEDKEIEIEDLNTKEYFYRIYKYSLKGKLDFDTFNNIIGLEYIGDWPALDYDSVLDIQFRTESAYNRMANKN